MSNIWTQFTSKFADLNQGNRTLSTYPLQSQQVFVCWLLTILNQYGDHLNHVINDAGRLELAVEAWMDGLRNHTPKHAVNVLHTFCDGKSHLAGRFECNMARSISEFMHEMRTNQHQTAMYDTEPKGLALDYDRDTARERDERGNKACMQHALKCLPSLSALIKKKEGRLAEIEAEGGERLELHRKRKEFYDKEMQEHGRITRDYVHH